MSSGQTGGLALKDLDDSTLKTQHDACHKLIHQVVPRQDIGTNTSGRKLGQVRVVPEQLLREVNVGQS